MTFCRQEGATAALSPMGVRGDGDLRPVTAVRDTESSMAPAWVCRPLTGALTMLMRGLRRRGDLYGPPPLHGPTRGWRIPPPTPPLVLRHVPLPPYLSSAGSACSPYQPACPLRCGPRRRAEGHGATESLAPVPPARSPPKSPGVPPPLPSFPNYRGGGGGWHKASVSDCLPLAAPIGLSPLLILTPCGSERLLVVSTEPLDDFSCLTTPGWLSPRRAFARAVDQVHPDAHSESMLGLTTPALTCARWGVHLQDNFPDRGF